VFVLGWLALAPICGVLAWRYGPPNSGKTTLHTLVTDLLRPLVVSADGQSTEAGLRQELGPDSLPIALDEFETDQRVNRLAGIMRLARSASSAESPVLRGTPEGKAMQFSLRTMFFFSAVNVTGMSPADETRIMMAELTAHDNDPQVGQSVAEALARFARLGPAWTGYMVSLAPQVDAAISAMSVALPSVNSRHRLNMATLMAGAFLALHGRAPNREEAQEWAQRYAPSVEHHGFAHDRDDAAEVLNYLLQHPVRSGDGVEMPLGHYLVQELVALQRGDRPNTLPDHTRITRSFDIRIVPDGEEPGWFIRNRSPAIDRAYKDTRWANGAWKRALGQLPGAVSPRDPMHFHTSGKHRCVGLPLELIPEPIELPLPPIKPAF
jgi:hypothetical protein